MLPDRGFSGAWGVAGGRRPIAALQKIALGAPNTQTCRRRRSQPVDVVPRSGFFSDISNCLTHASIGFDGAGELFEARAYTYDLLRAACLVWIELAARVAAQTALLGFSRGARHRPYAVRAPPGAVFASFGASGT